MGACMNKKFLLDEASSAWASAFIFIHNISWLNHVDHTRQQEAVVLGGLWLRRPGKVIQGSELRVLVRKIFTGDSMPATPWFPIQQWNNLLTVGGCSSATSWKIISLKVLLRKTRPSFWHSPSLPHAFSHGPGGTPFRLKVGKTVSKSTEQQDRHVTYQTKHTIQLIVFATQFLFKFTSGECVFLPDWKWSSAHWNIESHSKSSLHMLCLPCPWSTCPLGFH